MPELNLDDLQHTNIWNFWDEFGLYKGIDRKPLETNMSLRRRILDKTEHDSTLQGILNFLSSAIEVTNYTNYDKFVYYSVQEPLSYETYMKIVNKDEDFFAPEVEVNGVIYKMPATQADPDDLNNTYVKSVAYPWTLWKNQTTFGYLPIWQTEIIPDSIILRYQIYENNEFFIVEESAKKLTRDINGNIVEE